MPSTRCGRPERRRRRASTSPVGDAAAGCTSRTSGSPSPPTSARRLDLEAGVARARAASSTSPAARCPNRKFSPTTTAAACSARPGRRATNSSGVSRANSTVNGSTQDRVDAERLEQLGPVPSVGEHRRVRPGPDHLRRVRVEGHHHRAERPGRRPASTAARGSPGGRGAPRRRPRW